MTKHYHFLTLSGALLVTIVIDGNQSDSDNRAQMHVFNDKTSSMETLVFSCNLQLLISPPDNIFFLVELKTRQQMLSSARLASNCSSTPSLSSPPVAASRAGTRKSVCNNKNEHFMKPSSQCLPAQKSGRRKIGNTEQNKYSYPHPRNTPKKVSNKSCG